jgi:hypothetical protein
LLVQLLLYIYLVSVCPDPPLCPCGHLISIYSSDVDSVIDSSCFWIQLFSSGIWLWHCGVVVLVDLVLLDDSQVLWWTPEVVFGLHVVLGLVQPWWELYLIQSVMRL